MTPKIRQTAYYLGTITSAGLGIALIWGGVDAGAAEHMNQVLGGLLALVAGGSPALAARTVSQQSKDGAFDAAAPVAEQAITAIQATVEQAQTAQADMQRVTKAVTDALVSVPSLVDRALDSFTNAR